MVRDGRRGAGTDDEDDEDVKAQRKREREQYLDSALKLLADGRWQPYEQVMAQLVYTVAPWTAKREAEDARKYLALRRARARGEHLTAAPPRSFEVSGDRLWRSGGRTLIRRTLYRALFEVEGRGHNTPKRVRLSAAGRAEAKARGYRTRR